MADPGEKLILLLLLLSLVHFFFTLSTLPRLLQHRLTAWFWTKLHHVLDTWFWKYIKWRYKENLPLCGPGTKYMWRACTHSKGSVINKLYHWWQAYNHILSPHLSIITGMNRLSLFNTPVWIRFIEIFWNVFILYILFIILSICKIKWED